MSNILSGFSKETPQSLLALGHQTKLFPVDVAEICCKANVRLQPFDFNNPARYSPFKGDLKTIRGAIVVCDEQAAILYRTDSTILGRRFAIAHLIGHLCLHAEKEKPAGNEVWVHLDFSTEEPAEKEIQADLFARKILVPADTLLLLIQNTAKVFFTAVYDLSVRFMVSEELMRERLKELEIGLSD